MSEETFCNSVLDSDLNPIEKMKKLCNNPACSENIVGEILEKAPYLENYLEDKPVFPNDEDLRNFLGGNWDRFDALERCVNEIRNNPKYKELHEKNKKYVFDVSTAVTLVNIYSNLEEMWVASDCDNREEVTAFVNEALSLVEICAIYFKEARVKENNDIVYYRVGQKMYLEKYFDVLSGKSTETESSAEETKGENTQEEAVPTMSSATEQNNAKTPIMPQGQKKPGLKKIGMPLILVGICGIAFIISLVLALALDSLFGHFMLLGTGLVDFVVVFFMSSHVNKTRRLTCPECGAQRVQHRSYLETTKKEKFFERNPDKKADESIRFIITYTHWYLATFTCPNCGETLQEKVSDGGGVVTIYYSGREKDTRSQPREF